MHGDEYSKLWILVSISQNWSKLFINNTYTCPKKSTQNCSKVLKSTYTCPKKSAQDCPKLLKKYLYAQKICSKLLKIAQHGSKWLKNAQKCSKCLTMKMPFWENLRWIWDILRQIETYWDILGDRINTMHDNNAIKLHGVQVMIRR